MQMGCRLIPPGTRALPRGRLILWIRGGIKALFIMQGVWCPFCPFGYVAKQCTFCAMGI